MTEPKLPWMFYDETNWPLPIVFNGTETQARAKAQKLANERQLPVGYKCTQARSGEADY